MCLANRSSGTISDGNDLSTYHSDPLAGIPLKQFLALFPVGSLFLFEAPFRFRCHGHGSDLLTLHFTLLSIIPSCHFDPRTSA
jgi:hypothetical protein